MKPTPLLDMWQKPDGAGEPVAVFATTFTLDPDFFERNCLARFLALESADEESGSVEDIVAKLELEEGLRAPAVTVLADRSAHAERSTLRWDLLHCQVKTGLLHSKVAILMWEKATRVIIGSANLTPAGYRHNIELAMAADLGSACLLPGPVLKDLANELESYLDLVPGLLPDVPARVQAARILEEFRSRIGASTVPRMRHSVALAPCNKASSPLDFFPQVWSGAQPLRATQVSPYWDLHDTQVVDVVSKLLTGRPAAKRNHRVAVTLGPSGEISFPLGHRSHVQEVLELGPLDKNIRPLHAKALIIQNDQWISALIGSSNHTVAGFGLGKGSSPRHREINVWMGAALDSKEGKALRDLVPCGNKVTPNAAYVEAEDEDELDPDEASVLPAFFQLCRISRSADTWCLQLSFSDDAPPREWRVSLPTRQTLIDSHAWLASNESRALMHPIDPEHLPMFLDVSWDGNHATWGVLADDRHELPPGFGIADLESAQLLDALATGKSLAQLMRETLGRGKRKPGSTPPEEIITDPLKRFDSRSTLFRRGRALAGALAAMERRLSHPIATLDALDARLSGPLGPSFIATKLVAECEEGALQRPETLFTLAEIALSVARVPWDQAMRHVDWEEGVVLVQDVLEALDCLRVRIGTEPNDLADYAARAIKEARACMNA